MDDADLWQAVQEDLQWEPRVNGVHAAPCAGLLRIVAGYDGSAPASRALDAAVRLLKGWAGCIDVVWVAHLSSTVRLSADAMVEMEAASDELEPELGAQAAGQVRGRGAAWEFGRRQGVIAEELIAVAAGLRDARPARFGRRQPGPPFTGSPRDRALGSRCSKLRPGSGIRLMRTVTP